VKLSRAVERFLKEYCGETREDFQRLLNAIEDVRRKIEEDKDLTNHPTILKRLEDFRGEFEEEVSNILRWFSDEEENYRCISDAIARVDFEKALLAELEEELGLVKKRKNEEKREYDEEDWDWYPIIG